MQIKFHPAATEEVEAAARWYAERSPVAAQAFTAEVTIGVERINEAPERWPRYLHDTRRYFFPNFPFSLIYRVRHEELEIIAVAHHRRRPGYWRRLVRGMQYGIGYLQPRDHLHHYATRSLCRLLERNGFTPVAFLHLHPIQSVSGSKKALLRGIKNVWFEAARAVNDQPGVSECRQFVCRRSETVRLSLPPKPP